MQSAFSERDFWSIRVLEPGTRRPFVGQREGNR